MLSRLLTLNTALLAVLVGVIFLVPLLDVSWHSVAYNIGFTLLLVTSAFALLTKRRIVVVSFAIALILLEWIATLLNKTIVSEISQSAEGIYFVVIVMGLIHQTAVAKQVTVRVIADSLSGYLLFGMVLSIGTIVISQWNPGAYNFSGSEPQSVPQFSDCIYYTFITFSSTGYGDMLPVLPGAKSFAIFIVTSGQLYVAIIIALLVGKYSSTVVNGE